jgi:hypothetical protein
MEPRVNNDQGSSKGSSDEAIGRPKEWREGRYQQPGKPVDRSVIIPTDAENQHHDTISTPVTRKDYERGNGSLADQALAQWNIGTGAARFGG